MKRLTFQHGMGMIVVQWENGGYYDADEADAEISQRDNIIDEMLKELEYLRRCETDVYVNELKQRIEELEKALRFYADESNYDALHLYEAIIGIDYGKTAREALKKIGE